MHEENCKNLQESLKSAVEVIKASNDYNAKLYKAVIGILISGVIIVISIVCLVLLRDYIQYNSTYNYPDKSINQTQTTITGNENTVEKGGVIDGTQAEITKTPETTETIK